MVGVETVLADDPLMTVRLPGVTARPLRIVLDSRLRTPLASRLLRTAPDMPVLIVTTAATLEARGPLYAGIAGLDIATVPAQADGRLDPHATLGLLAARGLTRIFSEGGPNVAATLIEASLADDVLIFTAPRPLGAEGVATLRPTARAALGDPALFTVVDTREIGVDRLRHYARVL
jgi:diaminohydroxyphosphoribosylaminopyrimidine deaminase/5-amino-6-(5-phosphoribosylamino)uracil reductase